jgi:hypothetical protein
MSTLSGGPNIVVDGLVLYLDAANRYSYVSGSTTWNDLSRGGNNGTLINGPTFNSANGGSIVFDGIDDYVGSTLNSQLSNSFTFSTFIKLSAFLTNNNPQALVVSQVASYGNYWAFLGTYQSKWHWGLYDGSNNPFIVSNIVPTTSSWTYVTGIRDVPSDTLYLYINGVLDSSINDTTISIPVYSALNVGGQTTQTSRYSNCNIALTQVYNRALSAQEVLQNYNATKTRFGL